MTALLVLTACTPLTGWLFPDTGLPDEVALSGWVYTSPAPGSAEDVLTGGALTFTAPDGAWLVEGEPSQRNPGYWGGLLPPDEEFVLRVEGGEGFYPALWRGRSPARDGYWTGQAVAVEGAPWPGYALFGLERAFTDGVFTALAASFGVDVPALTDDTVHVWGAMATPGAAAGLEVGATCGDGVYQPALTLDLDPTTLAITRSEGGPVTWFFVFGCAAGAVEVSAGGASSVFPTRGGEIVTPWFFEVHP